MIEEQINLLLPIFIILFSVAEFHNLCSLKKYFWTFEKYI